MALGIELAERGLLPDSLLRLGIRRISRQRLAEAAQLSLDARQEDYRRLLQTLRQSNIALSTELANEQHYEVAPEFFALTLGPMLKYSCGYWPAGVVDLAAAERAMLELYRERAQLDDAQRVLDLGCGWGSLSLYFAPRLPHCEFVAVSNSQDQRRYIEAQATAAGLSNLQVITADVNDFEPDGDFDRIVSIEMFEHVRNYRELLERVSRWLRPAGTLFVHIFCHRTLAYPYVAEGDDNWMARHFFTDGLMPAADTLLHFQEHLQLADRWLLSGRHYAQTAEAWLDNFDAQRPAVRSALATTYGAETDVWLQRWRLFYLACAEFFALHDGNEWGVGHYLFERRRMDR